MNIKKKIVAISLFGLALSTPSMAETTLRIQTAQSAGDFVMSRLQDVWLPKLEAMSAGELRIQLLPTGAVVPHRETPEAVAKGILDGQMTTANYFAGRDPAFAMFGDLIAAYDSPDQGQTFCRNGGGVGILQVLYDTHFGENLHVVGCGPYAREALVAATPIKTLAEMKGKKIRAPEGLAAEVFREVGAAPVSIPFSEVYTSLETGLVDAADASALVNNEALGLHKIAKFPIYPGIHSQAVHSFSINKNKWDAMSEQEQVLLTVWYNAAYDDIRRAAYLADQETANELAARDGVEVIDWSLADRQAFREAAVRAWEQTAKKSDDAAMVYAAQKTYLRQIGLMSAE